MIDMEPAVQQNYSQAVKTCNYCRETKIVELFRHNRHQCLSCRDIYQKACRERRRKLKPAKVKEVKTHKTCSCCKKTREIGIFRKGTRICPDCKTEKHRQWTKERLEKEARSGLFIEINGEKLKARKCRRCSELKELRFFKQQSQTCIPCKAPVKLEVLERQKLRNELASTAIYKTCISCKIPKIVGEGISRKNNPYCKDCSNQKNREKYRRNNGKEYFKLKRKTNLAYNIETKLRSRLRNAIFEDEGKKNERTETLIGCSFRDFRKFLASKLTQGMTMDKILSAEIVLDHIIPCSLFDLTDESEQRRCFHYTNIQPLWKKDNDIKYDYYMGMKCSKIPKKIKRIESLIKIVEELASVS